MTTENDNANEAAMESVLAKETNRILFESGQVVATPGALDAMQTNNCLSLDLLIRHLSGDWGVIPEEDAQVNQQALEQGDRIMSSYPLANGEKVWVITEGDRSYTTFLLPEEY